MVDIDQASLEKLNISLSSLDSLKEQGITGLRIDDRLAPEQIADLSQKIEIGINGSTFTEEELKQLVAFDAKMESIQAWFNFYPCPDTGISRKFLAEQTKMFKHYGMNVQAFFAGDENLRGPLHEGLPTLEYQRYYDPLASILEFKELGIDLLYLGDPGISERSLNQIKTYQDEDSLVLYTAYSAARTFLYFIFIYEKIRYTSKMRVSPYSLVLIERQSSKLFLSYNR